MCAWFPHTLALFSRLGPWYRYTVSLPALTCLSISLFQWWISEAGQMIRVPLETTRLESWMINKQTEIYQNVHTLNNQFKTDLQNSDKTRSFDPIQIWIACTQITMLSFIRQTERLRRGFIYQFWRSSPPASSLPSFHLPLLPSSSWPVWEQSWSEFSLDPCHPLNPK